MTERSEPIPALTGAQMAAVDRVLVDELRLDVLQIMEIAGLAVARFARARFFDGDPRGRRVVVLAGGGGNGGDGLVAARHLHGWGVAGEVRLAPEPATLRGSAAHQLLSVNALGIPVRPPSTASVLPPADLVIDALLGFSLTGAPTGSAAALIRAANAHPAPVLAVDLPSGLEATTGVAFDPCVRADATLTLALPKTGLLAPAARAAVGELHVADIGVPAAAYARLGVEVPPLFAVREVVPIVWP